jgi:DNA-directed RNA polymerase beta subunit
LTNDIPNVSEEATKDLDENGMIRIGAEVKPGDIGKITPKENQILLQKRNCFVQSSVIKQVM